MNRDGNSANFFSYVCYGKKIKELFASTLNRIPISVRCVSSMLVVINAKFARLLAVPTNSKYGEKRRSPAVLLVETYRSLYCARKTSLLYIFQRPMQANKNLTL